MGPMAIAGVSDAVVYGRYPVTVPLIAAGLAWAGITAARADWGDCGVGLAVAVTGAVALSAGPAGAWAITGVGLCAHAPGPSGHHRLAAAPQRSPAMTTDELDPLIHVPTRLKIVATLAALHDGDTLSFTRLQDMIGLTPGNLIIHLRKLEEADYISSEKTSNGSVSITTVALTGHGRAELDSYTQALRDLRGWAVWDG